MVFTDIFLLGLHTSVSEISFLYMHACVHSHVWLFAIPWTVDCQAPLFMESPRQEYWSGLPFPFQGDLPNPEIEPVFSALPGDFLP